MNAEVEADQGRADDEKVNVRSLRNAICDGCDELLYHGRRHTCLDCQNHDSCDECLPEFEAEHGGHRLAQVYMRPDIANKMSEAAFEAFQAIREASMMEELVGGERLIRAHLKIFHSYPEVIIGAVEFYLSQGLPNRAEEILKQFYHYDVISDPDFLLDEKYACLALLKAILIILRYCAYEDAANLCASVEKMFLHCDFSGLPDGSNKSSRDLQVNSIIAQSALWKMENPDKYDDSSPITDFRVLLEIYRLQLKLALHLSGLISSHALGEMCRRQLIPLKRYLAAQGRGLMEYEVTMAHGIYECPESLREFQKFYQSHIGKDWGTHLKHRFSLDFSYKSLVILFRMNDGMDCLNAVRVGLRALKLVLIHLGCPSKLRECEIMLICAEPPQSCSVETKLGKVYEVLVEHGNRPNHNLLHTVWQCAKTMATASSKAWEIFGSIYDHLKTLSSRSGNLFFSQILRLDFAELMVRRFATAKDALRELTQILDQEKELSNWFYAQACRNMWTGLAKLGFHEQAVQFVSKDIDSEYAKSNSRWQSQAIHALELNKFKALRYSKTKGVRNLYPDTSTGAEKQGTIVQLLSTVDVFKRWIPFDLEQGWNDLRREKAALLLEIFMEVSQIDPGSDEIEGKSLCTNILTDMDAYANEFLRLQKAMSAGLGGYQCTIREPGNLSMIREFIQVVRGKPTMSCAGLSVNFAIASIMQLGHQQILKQTAASEMLWRVEQLEYLLKDHDAMLADRKAEEILLRVPMFCEVVLDCVKLLPVNETYWLTKSLEFFSCANDVYRYIRNSLRSDTPTAVDEMLLRRRVLGKTEFRTVHTSIINFYLSLDFKNEAWRWLQYRRGRATVELLEDHAASHVYISSLLQGNAKLLDMFKREKQLQAQVAHAFTENAQSAARTALAQHRSWMRGDAALIDVFEDDKEQNLEGPGLASDIWSTAKWLPPGSKILILDWVVGVDESLKMVAYPKTSAEISHDTEQIGASVAVEDLQIKLSDVVKWRSEYMQFPPEGKKPLDNVLRPAEALRPLISPLKGLCNPGDLLVITPPDVLEGLPIHAIPFMGRKPLISTNPVVYSSSMTMYRKCLHRARTRVVPGELEHAVFIGALEENNSDEERSAVYKDINSLSKRFEAYPIWGLRATSMMMTLMLFTSPWVHFHGHALLAKDPLKQALLLSGKLESEDTEMVGNVILSMLKKNSKKALTDDEIDTARQSWGFGRQRNVIEEVQGANVSPKTHIAHGEASIASPSKSSRVSGREVQSRDMEDDEVVQFVYRDRYADIAINVKRSELERTKPAENQPDPLMEQFGKYIISQSSLLPVSDILTFSLNIGNSPFVCCIACDSGVQDIESGHEPLGLVSALLCAGASAVVGTLWPIRSDMGRRFSKLFYDNIASQIKKGPVLTKRTCGKRVLNVAESVRFASEELKRLHPYPYNWASFVLYGSAFYLY